MTLKLRLARFGRRNAPFYNIVVAHARSRRDGKPLEVIGTYDPIPRTDPYQIDGKRHKNVQLDVDRAKYWVGVGAQPTDTVWRLLSMLNVLEPKYNALDPISAKKKQPNEIRKAATEVWKRKPETVQMGTNIAPTFSVVNSVRPSTAGSD